MSSTRSLGKFTVTRGPNGYTFRHGTLELLTLRPTSTDGPERLSLLRTIASAEASHHRSLRRCVSEILSPPTLALPPPDYRSVEASGRIEVAQAREALDEFNDTHRRNPCVETARRWRIPRNVVTWGWKLREAAVLHGVDVSESEMGQADILEEIAW